jgi:tRNA U34 2-thiouridine synthase MnmA/TrmU
VSEKVKAIGILSGGLDSMLAAKVLQEQGIEILGITFVTPFFGPEAGIEAGRKAGIPLLAVDISAKHFEMLKNPRYGYGSRMNPCIDCHGLMLQEAGKIMEREGAAFLFTGEVLAQRPMSQRRDSMRSVEKLSGFPGRVLRPLSAKLLTPTIVELEGLVDRERLLDIQGRSRRRQKELAEHYGISDYPQPGGGCMLTSEGFSKRLHALLGNYPGATVSDVEIIKCGRAFLLPGKSICMVGRQLSDNLKMESIARDSDVFLRPLDCPGPTSLLLSCEDPSGDMQMAAELVASYSDAPQDTPVAVEWRHNGKSGTCIALAKTRAAFKDMLLT